MNRILKSKYKVGEKIFDCQTHITYRGSFVDSEKEIAIKIYKKEYLNTFIVKKLKKDIEIFSKIESPLIPKLIDGDYGWQGFYFIREYVDGLPLSELKTHLELDKVIEIISSVCSTIKFAHDNKIIHGSITPNNVFIQRSNSQVKVADFGIKRSIFETIEQKAKLLFALDLQYVPPEVLLGEEPTAKSDIYQIGILFAQLLTNEKKHKEKERLSLAKEILESKKKNILITTKIPKYVEEIINICIDHDPLSRFDSVDEIINCLNTKSVIKKRFNFIDFMEINLASEEEIQDEKIKNLDINNNENSETKTADIGLFSDSQKKDDKIIFIKWAIVIVLIAILMGIAYSFIYIFFFGE